MTTALTARGLGRRRLAPDPGDVVDAHRLAPSRRDRVAARQVEPYRPRRCSAVGGHGPRAGGRGRGSHHLIRRKPPASPPISATGYDARMLRGHRLGALKTPPTPAKGRPICPTATRWPRAAEPGEQLALSRRVTARHKQALPLLRRRNWQATPHGRALLAHHGGRPGPATARGRNTILPRLAAAPAARTNGANIIPWATTRHYGQRHRHHSLPITTKKEVARKCTRPRAPCPHRTRRMTAPIHYRAPTTTEESAAPGLYSPPQATPPSACQRP